MGLFLLRALSRRTGQKEAQAGLTLIELLISIIVLVLLVGIAVPSFVSLIERNRLSGAAQTAYAELQRVRAEAIESDSTVFLYAEPGADWCIAVADEASRTANCNCDGSGGVPVCQLDGTAYITSAEDFPGISMTRTTTYTGFDPQLGMTASAAMGNMTFTQSDMHLKVIFSMLGRVKMCYRSDPGDAPVPGYEACS